MKKKRFKFEYLKGKAMDRKGMGMELALLVLLVVFACSILLVSSALIGKENLQAKEDALYEHILLDELAEKVMAVEDGGSYDAILADPRFADYAVVKEDSQGNRQALFPEGFEATQLGQSVHGAHMRWVILDLEGTPLMSVELDSEQKVIRWTYY